MVERIVRVYQEDWWPFQNLPKALKEFEKRTGIRAELNWDTVGIGTVEPFWQKMDHAFLDDRPKLDLICTDELLLRRYAARGAVYTLNEHVARDAVEFDVTSATRRVMNLDGMIIGLPCVNVCNMLLYRKDLFERYSLAVPQNWSEVLVVGRELQTAMRRDLGEQGFSAFATRAAPGAAHAAWSIGSFLGSFGARWLDEDQMVCRFGDEHRSALETYVELLRALAPSNQAEMSFVEVTREYRAGRIGMALEVGHEYAHILKADPEMAEKSGVALVPAGPKGRFPDLYCPLWAIPRNSEVKEEAWLLAKYLTSDTQLLEDGVSSEAIETSSLSVLYGSEFDAHFRDDLLSTTRQSRAILDEGRPFSDTGSVDICEFVGDAVSRCLTGDLTVDAALSYIRNGFISSGLKAA